MKSSKDVAKSSGAIVVVFPPAQNSTFYFARESLKIAELVAANAPFLASNAALDRAKIFDDTIRSRVSYGDDTAHDCVETMLRVLIVASAKAVASIARMRRVRHRLRNRTTISSR